LHELESRNDTADYDIAVSLIHSVVESLNETKTFGIVRNEVGLPPKPAYCHLAADSGQAPPVCATVPPPTCP
jgi:hypothetical protein